MRRGERIIHIAPAGEARREVIASGILGDLAPHAKNFHMPVRYLISNILKLVTLDPEQAAFVAHDPAAMQAAMALVRTDDEGTSCEAARAVANMLRGAPNDTRMHNFWLTKKCNRSMAYR